MIDEKETKTSRWKVRIKESFLWRSQVVCHIWIVTYTHVCLFTASVVRLVAPGDEGEVLHEIECNGSYSILKVRQELSVQWHQAVEDIQLSYQGIVLL